MIMPGNFRKFLFLGAMLVAAVIAARGAVLPRPAIIGAENTLADAASSSAPGGGPEAPLFVLRPPLGARPAAPSAAGAYRVAGNGGSVGFLSAPITIAAPSAAPLAGNLNSAADISESLGAVTSKSDGPLQPVFYHYGNGGQLRIGARLALLADLWSKQIYFSSNPDARWPLASLSKLMTAAVVSRNIPLNQSAPLTEKDFPSEYSSPDMKPGDRFTMGDLRSAMLMESNNEAATALANFYGYDKFISAMNAQARDWNLNDTHFDGVVGLSAADQSTAADLLRMTGYLYGEYPEIFRITRDKSVVITELVSGKKITVNNINIFAGEPDFLGGKTGYTDEASGNLLSIFSYENRPILVIVLGSSDRFGDTHNLINWFEQNYK